MVMTPQNNGAFQVITKDRFSGLYNSLGQETLWDQYGPLSQPQELEGNVFCQLRKTNQGFYSLLQDGC